MTPMQKMQETSPDLLGDLHALRRKNYGWRSIARLYGVTHAEAKDVAFELGLAKRPGTHIVDATPVRVMRCSRADAVAIATAVGLSVKTVLSRVYAMPELSLDEIRAHCFAVKGKRGGRRAG